MVSILVETRHALSLQGDRVNITNNLMDDDRVNRTNNRTNNDSIILEAIIDK